jgi:hypothetical protein
VVRRQSAEPDEPDGRGAPSGAEPLHGDGRVRLVSYAVAGTLDFVALADRISEIYTLRERYDLGDIRIYIISAPSAGTGSGIQRRSAACLARWRIEPTIPSSRQV